jgi:alkane 1-monooxygenase
VEWSERTATALEALPAIYVFALAASLVVTLVRLRQADLPASALAGLGASLFAVFVLASCVAHALLHRRSAFMRALGSLLSGVIGYPLLESDHRNHHWFSNRMALAEAPYPCETVWAFSLRRLKAVGRRAMEERRARIEARHGRCLLAIAALLTSALLFGFAAGMRGFTVYLVVAGLSVWSLQAITYLQHWGLAPRTCRQPTTGGKTAVACSSGLPWASRFTRLTTPREVFPTIAW